MRWPFRRQADGSTEPPATAAAGTAGAGSEVVTGQEVVTGTVGRPGAGGADGRDGVSVTRPPARQWTSLPPIPVTIERRPPLVMGAAPVTPPILAGRHRPVAKADVPLGSVVGLVTPVVRAPEPAPAAAAPVLPAPVVRRPSRELPAEVPTLVEAVDAYVGEAREPAEPHRAPGWLRFAPTWATPAEAALPALPARPEPTVGEPPSFLPPELRNKPAPEPAPQPELPPHVQESVQAPELTPKPMRRRRPNLGESRRLGLGAPITVPEPGDVPELVHPEPPAVVEGEIETPQAEAPEPQEAPQQREEPPPPREEPPGPPPPPKAPVYRAAPELRPAPRPKALPRATVVRTEVPPDLSHAVRARQQADVSTVPVYRGPKVGEAARDRGARAFAAGGAVFLPDEAGAIDSPRTRGLLAHELVHAVQQRTLGAHLPAPDSPLGQELEAQAQAAERYYGGESGAAEPPPLVHAPSPVRHSEPELTAPAQHAGPLTAPPPPAPAPQEPLHSPFDPTTRAEVGRIAQESAQHVIAEWKNPVLHKEKPEQTETPGEQGPRKSRGTGGAAHKPAFDREARREELTKDALDMINIDRSLAGQSPVSELDEEHRRRIERKLDLEESGGEDDGGDNLVPPNKRFKPNSANAWMQGLTGRDPTRGLFGERGATAPVGSEGSWFESEDKRPFKERLKSAVGLSSFTNQFDSDNWFDKDEPASATETPETAAQETHASAAAQGHHAATGEVDIDGLDLDELSDRIYDRLRRRLRTELLVDRERAGLLSDFR